MSMHASLETVVTLQQAEERLPEERGETAVADDEELDAAVLGLGEDGLRLGLAALRGGLDAPPDHPRAGVARLARGAHGLHEIPAVRASAPAEEHRDRGAGGPAGRRARGPGPGGAVVRVGHVDVQEQDVVALHDGVGERPLHGRRRLAAGVGDDHDEPRLGRRAAAAAATAAAPPEVDQGHAAAAAGRRCRMHARAARSLAGLARLIGDRTSAKGSSVCQEWGRSRRGGEAHARQLRSREAALVGDAAARGRPPGFTGAGG